MRINDVSRAPQCAISAHFDSGECSLTTSSVLECLLGVSLQYPSVKMCPGMHVHGILTQCMFCKHISIITNGPVGFLMR